MLPRLFKRFLNSLAAKDRIALADPSQLRARIFENGSYIIKYKKASLFASFKFKPDIELLFVAAIGEKLAAELETYSFPGSAVIVQSPVRSVRADAGDLLAAIASRLASMAANEQSRIFFILDETFSASVSELIRRFPRSTFIFVASSGLDATRALFKDFAGRALTLLPDGRLSLEKGKTFEPTDEGAGNESPADDAAASWQRIIKIAADLAGIDSIQTAPVKVGIGDLYIYGSPLEIDLDKPEFVCYGRPDLPPAPLSADFDWNANPYNDRNWLAQSQMWRALDDYIIKYEKTGDMAWLAAPVRIVKWWHDFYKKSEPVEAVWTDMNAGLRAMKLAYFLSLSQRGEAVFDQDFINVCEDLAEKHILFIIHNKKPVFSNHTLIDLHGLAALCQTARPVLASAGLDYIEANYDAVMASQFDDNGVHREHSPGYQHFVWGYLKVLSRAGWFKTGELRELESKAREALDWMHVGWRKLAPIGDTDAKLLSRAPLPPPSDSGVFNKSGYAIVRLIRSNNPAKSSYLLFMGASNSKIHKHSDDLSIYWHEGQDILCDAGKYAYQHSPKRAYVVSTRAHNTIEINGRDTFIGSAPATNPPSGNYIKSVFARNGVYFLAGEMTAPRFNVAHKRTLIFEPGKFLVVIDKLKSPYSNRYAANWHFPPGADARIIDDGEIELILPDGAAVYAALFADRPFGIELIKGREEAPTQGFISESYRSLTPNYCASLSAEGRDALVISTFFLDKRPACHFYENSVLFFNNYMYDIGNERFSGL
ncbi:MAG: heparinase II/III-family protein [Desulfovibrio sp.]|nr:heparinase II/III-family protein [Desulfovibrio sp.]